MKTTKNKGFARLIILAFATIFISVSCHNKSEKAGEKLMENAIENATGKDAKVNIDKEKTVIETDAGKLEVDGNAKSWPNEIPGDIPEFKFGKIDAVTTRNFDNTKAWIVSFSELQDGFLDKYDAQLKDKGFETILMKMGDKGGSITAENEKYNVFLMGGEGTLSLSVTIKKQE